MDLHRVPPATAEAQTGAVSHRCYWHGPRGSLPTEAERRHIHTTPTVGPIFIVSITIGMYNIGIVYQVQYVHYCESSA